MPGVTTRPGTVFRDNCLPIVEAGQALLVDDDDALILPIHFPAPTVGLIKPLGAAFDYRFRRE